MPQPKISVCIPAYEMNGQGAVFLEELFSSLAVQSLQDFEVVVSDQSADDAVLTLCHDWGHRLDLRHIWNKDGKRQASANVNNAMQAARGRVLKILFQDDYLCAPTALEQTFAALDRGGAKWLLAGSGVTRNGGAIERPMVPSLGPKLHFGKNTVSSPSVLALTSGCTERFDENLVWLMDVEMYKRLWDAYGEPVILPQVQIVNRLHDAQVSEQVDRALQRRELDYIWRKYAGTTAFSGKLEYVRRRLKTIFAA